MTTQEFLERLARADARVDKDLVAHVYVRWAGIDLSSDGDRDEECFVFQQYVRNERGELEWAGNDFLKESICIPVSAVFPEAV